MDGGAATRRGPSWSRSRASSPPATRSTWSTTRWCCCAASRHDRAARDLPPAARRATSASPRRARSCRICATWASRTCTCRRRSRRARGRRTATTSSTRASISNELGGEDGVPRAGRRGARGRHGDRARHRPQPHGDRRREPLLDRPGAARAVLRHRRGHRPPPALLRRRPSGRRCARRTRRCSRRRTRWRCGWCARARSTGCGSTIPTGSPIPAGYLRRLRDDGVEHVWVEKILDPGEPLRDWPVEGTVGYEFLNDVCGAVRRPGRRGAADRPVGGDLRRRPALRRVGVRGQARAGAHDVRARGRAAACARRPSASPGSSARSPRCPVYRTYVEPWSGRVADADREAVARGAPAGVAGARAAAGGRPAGTRSSRASSRRRRR